MTQVKCKIKKGDTVVVTTGRNKGATGEVLSVNPTESKVVVQGVNVVKKHVKPTQLSAGGIESRELPLHISNVALADPKDGKPTRVGYRIEKDGTKVRVARRSGEVVTQGASAAKKEKPAAKAKKTKD